MKIYVPSSLLVVLCVLSVSACHHRGPIQKKPVVYIYPTEKQMVTINLNFNGKLRATYPEYKTEWKFMADVDGTLTNPITNDQYHYLFYDGISDVEFSSFKEGFSVNTDTIISFLEHKLTLLGLNSKERNDMISFWLPELNEQQFSLIRFRINNACNEISTLKIIPKPDTEIRIMMEFLPAGNYIQLPEQKLNKTIRKGFTVVEWGGTNLVDQKQGL